jgi:hypothetical protein
MTRLAAVEKLQFYPFPRALAEDLGTWIAFSETTSPTFGVLDPCAGDGKALRALCTSLSRVSVRATAHGYGVELDAARAASAAKLFGQGRIVCGDGTALRASGFAIQYLNPPYAPETAEGGTTTRQEDSWLVDAVARAPDYGVIFWVVPEPIYRAGRWRNLSVVVRHVARVPAEEYSHWKQVVVCFQKTKWATWSGLTEPSAWGPPSDPVAVRGTSPDVFVVIADDPNNDVVEAPTLIQEPRIAVQLEASHASAMDRPLRALRSGHQALLLAAGALNGAQVGHVIVRGTARRAVDKTYESRDGVEVEVETERVHTLIETFDLRSGQVVALDSAAQGEGVRQWFLEHAGALTQHVLEAHPPLLDDATLASYTPRGTAPRGNSWYKEQLATARAGIESLRKHRRFFLAAEQGLGKTAMSSELSTAFPRKPIVVLCPAHLVKTWHQEFEAVTGRQGLIVETMATAIAGCERARAGRVGALIISKDLGKRGARWLPSVIARPVRGKPDLARLACPHCYAQKTIVTAPPASVPSDHRALRTFLAARAPDLLKLRSRCDACKAPLWMIDRSSSGTVPIVDVIAKKLKGRFICVLDEAHKYAGSDTDQSAAADKLAYAAWGTVLSTGSIFDGVASNLFRQLYRVHPEFRKAYKYDQVSVFVDRHGTRESTRVVAETTAALGGKRGGAMVREVPGIDPAVFGWLSGWTAFLRRRDLPAGSFPHYSEQAWLVDEHDEIVTASNAKVEEFKRLRRDARQAETLELRNQYMSEASKAFFAALALCDVPPSTFTGTTRKETDLVRIVLEERAAGRGVLVCCSQPIKTPIYARLQATLEAHGIRVGVLSSTTASAKNRGDAFEALTKTSDVILTNAALIETGLSLFWAVTIIQYGSIASSYMFRQAARRSLRLTQTKPVKVIFMAVRKTKQEDWAENIVRKGMAAAQLEDDPIGGIAEALGGAHETLTLQIRAAVFADEYRDKGAW